MAQLQRNCVIIFCFIVSFIVTENESSLQEASESSHNAREKFVNLLTNIVDVNKKRIHALKAYGQLSDFNVNSAALRSKAKGPLVVYINANDVPHIIADDAINEDVISYDHEDTPQIQASVSIINKKYNEPKLNYNNKTSKKAKNNVGLNVTNETEHLRSELKEALRYSSKCRRRARRQCKKVCKNTLSRVCRYYTCSGSFKTEMKFSCLGYCRKAFDYY